MAKTLTKKTLQKQQIVESYLKTTSKATFNRFAAKKEHSIGNIDVGATSALHVMKHWISLYNNLTSMRCTTAKLMKLPTRSSTKFQAIYKKIKALRDAYAQYEVESITALGRHAKSASTSLESIENPVQKTERTMWNMKRTVMNNEQESDKQEHEGDEQEMHQLRVVAKKRILEGTIPLSDSLYIPKREGLSSVLLNICGSLSL
jgi:hypothetical protein